MRKWIPVGAAVALGLWWLRPLGSPVPARPLPAVSSRAELAPEPEGLTGTSAAPLRHAADTAVPPTEVVATPPRWALADPQGLTSVTGTFLLPPGFDQMDIALGVRWPTDANRGWEEFSSHELALDAGGSFRFHGVPAGPCQVYAQFGDRYFHQDVQRVDLLVAQQGESSAGTIDLRSRLRLVHIRVTDEDGQPIPGTKGIHNPPFQEEIEFEDGCAVIAVHLVEDSAWFVAPERRAVAVRDLPDGLEISLLPAPIQVLKVQNPELLPPAPWHLALQLHADPAPISGRAPFELVHSKRLRVTPEGVVRIPVSLPQRSRLSYALERDGEPGRSDIVRPVEACGDLRELSVSDTGGTATLTLDAELMAAALARVADSE
jgi:hypothetical protein